MKTKTYRVMLAFIALVVFGMVSTRAQTEHQHENGDKKAATLPNKKGQKHLDQAKLKKDLADRKNEPHYVMAMAYLQNLGTFAKALSEQASEPNQLSADFARAVVAEINRSLDKAEEHHQEHLKSLSADMRARVVVMMKGMDVHRSGLKDAVGLLEKDVQDYTLNSQKIATDSAEIVKHLDEMSKMHLEN